MASTMSPEDFALGLGRTVCVGFQHGGPSSLTSVQPRPDAPVNKMNNILLDEYHGDPNTSSCRITRLVPDVAGPEEVSTT